MPVLPSLTSYEIRDLASVASKDDKYNIIPPDALIRCYMDGILGIPTQIIGDKLNVFCTKSQLAFLPEEKRVEFTPGFSFVNMIEAAFDPLTITMTFSYNGQPVGQVSAEPSQLITKPMSGEVTLFLGIDIDGETIVIPYTTTSVYVAGFPLTTPWQTWGDWTSHGDVLFPMAVQSQLPDVLKIGKLSITAQYVTLANPTDLIDVSTDQKAYPFQANKSAVLYTAAQYQLSEYVSYIPIL